MNIGSTTKLKIAREASIGLFLEDQSGLEILLPKRYCPKDYELGDLLEVFIYKDNEDRFIATTEKPLAQVGDFAFLEVRNATGHGAFLNWGIMKDLFVPFKNQAEKMKQGKSYMVYVMVDQLTNRLVGSSRIDKFLMPADPSLEKGQMVQARVFAKTDIGFKVIVNGVYHGMIYKNQTFQPVQTGEEMMAYVNQVREDGKLDLLLQKPGIASMRDASDTLLEALNEHNGFMRLNDKSSPKEIYDKLGLSKKQFKKALGHLYKQRKVLLIDNGIQLKPSKA